MTNVDVIPLVVLFLVRLREVNIFSFFLVESANLAGFGAIDVFRRPICSQKGIKPNVSVPCTLPEWRTNHIHVLPVYRFEVRVLQHLQVAVTAEAMLRVLRHEFLDEVDG